MPRDELDDALLNTAFAMVSSPGAYALLIGAGVSASSGVPTAWGVLEDLIGRIATSVGEDVAEDLAAWYEERFGEIARYETVLERVAGTPLERQRLLKRYFEPTEEEREGGRKQPTLAHRSIARLVAGGFVRVILTLNFDHLLERAVRDVGIEPTIVRTVDDLGGLGPLHTIGCCIVHVHGDYLSPSAMLNTVSELAEYDPRMLEFLGSVFKDYGLVAAGWSSTYDPALRQVLRSHFSDRFTLSWIEPGEPGPEAVELMAAKRGRTLRIGADCGFGRIADAVIAMRDRESRHPLTVGVAVETAKRELAGKSVAIGLHDVLRRELDTLDAIPEFRLPDYQSDSQYGGYEAMVERIQESSKVAAALVATLAYWGDDQSDGWWVEDLERFATHARGGGLTALLTLRQVAGVSLFYSAGIAAVAGRRYGLLRRLFELQTVNPYRSGAFDRLTVALDADRVFSSAGVARVSSHIDSVLAEALQLGHGPLVDSWQKFEVLRLAAATMNSDQFDARSAKLLLLEQNLLDVAARVEDALKNGLSVDELRLEQSDAWRSAGLELGNLARFVPLERPRILTEDDRGDDKYPSPVATRLLLEVESQGDRHPLIEQGVADEAFRLAAAIKAVNVQAGRKGGEMAWKSHQPDGSIPMAIWLDSGKPPEG